MRNERCGERIETEMAREGELRQRKGLRRREILRKDSEPMWKKHEGEVTPRR